MTTTKLVGHEHAAVAKAMNLPVSTKHCIEMSTCLRNRDITFAKKFLNGVIKGEQAVAFLRFRRNVGHKAGMATGRFP